MFKFRLSSYLLFYLTFLILVEVENDPLLRDVTRSWKMILCGHGKSWKIFREKVWEP